jgi:hypothetical protein
MPPLICPYVPCSELRPDARDHCQSRVVYHFSVRVADVGTESLKSPFEIARCEVAPPAILPRAPGGAPAEASRGALKPRCLTIVSVSLPHPFDASTRCVFIASADAAVDHLRQLVAEIVSDSLPIR